MTFVPNDYSKAQSYDDLALTTDELVTLAGLRSGELVAVPREPVNDLLQRWRTWTPLQQPFMGTAKELKRREAESREAGLRLMLAGAYMAAMLAAAPAPKGDKP